jgi:hypothetical protein
MSIGDALATGWLGSSLTTCAASLGVGAEPGNELFDPKGPRAETNDTGTGAFPDASSFGMFFTGGATIGIPAVRVCD